MPTGTALIPLRSHPFIPALRAKSFPWRGRGCLKHWTHRACYLCLVRVCLLFVIGEGRVCAYLTATRTDIKTLPPGWVVDFDLVTRLRLDKHVCIRPSVPIRRAALRSPLRLVAHISRS